MHWVDDAAHFITDDAPAAEATTETEASPDADAAAPDSEEAPAPPTEIGEEVAEDAAKEVGGSDTTGDGT